MDWMLALTVAALVAACVALAWQWRRQRRRGGGAVNFTWIGKK